MSKITIETVQKALIQSRIDDDSRKEVLKKIREFVESDKEEPEPRVKRQLVPVVFGDDGDDMTASIIAIPEDEHPGKVLSIISAAATDFNASKRGRKLPVMNVAETIENVSARFFKEHGAVVRTKTPVVVVRSDNEL